MRMNFRDSTDRVFMQADFHPLAMQHRGRVWALAEAAVPAAGSGWSWSQMVAGLTSFITQLIQIFTDPNWGDAERKAAVISVVEKLYDAFIDPLIIPFVPGPIKRWILDPLIKRLLPGLVDGIYEAVAKWLKGSPPPPAPPVPLPPPAVIPPENSPPGQYDY